MSEVVHIPDAAWAAMYAVLDGSDFGSRDNDARAAVVAAADHIARAAQVRILRELYDELDKASDARHEDAKKLTEPEAYERLFHEADEMYDIACQLRDKANELEAGE